MIENLLFSFQVLLIDLFTAFGLTTILFLILSIFLKNDFIKQIEYQSNRFISLIGIIYIIVWIILLILELSFTDEEIRTNLLSRMFGKYWFGVWLQPLLWFSMSQLLRIKAIQKNILLKLIFCFFFILSIEKIVIITSSFHSDYLPSSWTMYSSIYPSNIFLEILIRISIYLLFVGFFKIITRKLNQWKTNKTNSQ